MSIKSYDTYRDLSLGVTGKVVYAAPGHLFGWHISNQNANEVYVKIYDKATAPDENDTPRMTITIDQTSGYSSVEISGGIFFNNGISVRATTGVSDGDTAAPAANDVVANIFYR